MEQEFLSDVVTRLERAGVDYALTGSVASSLWGIPRTTHDVDIVLILRPEVIAGIVATFGDRYYVSESAIREAVARKSMFNIIDPTSGLKADLWIASGDPFSEELLQRRRRIEISSGRQAFVASPEDVLLHKLIWHKATSADRQLADAAGIVLVQAANLDVSYLRMWAAKQSTDDLLEAILQGRHGHNT